MTILIHSLVASLLVGSVFAYFPSYNVPYCHHDFNTRTIPALSAEEAAQVKSLEQVQVIVRHGARQVPR